MTEIFGARRELEGCTSPADCKEAIEKLYTYLDGELTNDRRKLISDHLDECHSCLDAFDFESDLRKTISMKCKDHVPPHLLERVANAIKFESSKDGE